MPGVISIQRTLPISSSPQKDYPHRRTLGRGCCIAWCTPVMGVIVWGASPLCEIGSLKEIISPSDTSDWQSTR